MSSSLYAAFVRSIGSANVIPGHIDCMGAPCLSYFQYVSIAANRLVAANDCRRRWSAQIDLQVLFEWKPTAGQGPAEGSWFVARPDGPR